MILRLTKLLILPTVVLLAQLFLLKPAFALPDPVGYVNDFADVLSEDFEQNLEEKLASVSAQLGPEIAVVTIRSLEGDTIENYAVELFNEWGIGKKDQDNGVLFLAAIDEREMRIEVGYGAEASLNDAKAGRIIRNTIAPEFKNQDYEAGIEKGTAELITSVTGEEIGESTTQPADESGPNILIRIIFFATILSYLAAFLARSKSWWAGGMIGFLIGIFTSLTAGFIFGIIGLILDKILSSNYKKLRTANQPTGFWSSRGGFWTGGGKSSGGFGGFGGGSSGGGGASGSW